MDAYLVRSASVKLDFEQRRGVDVNKVAPVGAGFTRVGNFRATKGFLFCGHAYALDRVAANGQLDPTAAGLERALHQCDIRFIYSALAKGFAEAGVGGVGFRDENDSGGFLVEAVNNSGTQGVTQLREGLAAAEESVDHSAGRVASACMDGHPSGLIDGDDVGIFKQNVERNRFRMGSQRGPGLGSHENFFARVQAK